jgi:hypothetical protein
VTFRFLRGVAAFLLILAGGVLSLFSIAVAFGWDRGPLSAAGTIIAISGLSFMFWGYWAARKMDGGPLAGGCVKVALGVGGALLVPGAISIFIPGNLPTPTGYFLAVGRLCCVAFYGFRAYTRDH